VDWGHGTGMGGSSSMIPGHGMEGITGIQMVWWSFPIYLRAKSYMSMDLEALERDCFFQSNMSRTMNSFDNS